MMSDYGFKKTFGNEKDHTFIRNALPLLMKTPIKIKKIRHLPTEFAAITASGRKGFYDTVFLVDNELYFIVEMQLGNHSFLLERLMYYLSFLYVSKIKKGKRAFTNVKKVHCVCITRDTLFHDVKEYHHKANFRTEAGLLISEKMELIFVELEKFTKLADELDNELEELLFTMKNAHTIDLDKPFKPTFWKKPWLKKALKELELSGWETDNRIGYEIAYMGLIGAAEQEEIDERKRAFDIQQAGERARKEASEQAKEQAKAQIIKTVERLLLSGKLNIEEIAEVYDVSIDFILDIKNKTTAN
jgi:predicted transposase/invertase (TIGR01784 family)